jgi:hypothetical protein
VLHPNEDVTLRHRGYLLAAALCVLSACSSDDTTGVNGGVSGSVVFDFTGGGGGNYNATGAIAANASASTVNTTTWAAGYKDNNDNSTNVAANIAHASNQSDLFVATIARQTVGSSNVDSSCSPTSTTACTSIFLILGSNSSTGDFSWVCDLTAGTVTITSISGNNAQGTFSGTGSCSQSTGGTSTWVVTNGSFNVPLLATPPTIPS